MISAELLLLGLQIIAPAVAQSGEDDRSRKARLIEEHYAKWVGVLAPELGPDARDRVAGPAIELKALRGKRVLLLGVTGAGDFVNAPDKKALAATVEAVARARKAEGEKLSVIGFTKSLTPGLPADVPVVMVTNRRFHEPFELLWSGLGGFAIDTKGVITKVYAHALNPEEILEAAKAEDWKGEARPASSMDPWAGKGPPRPRHTLVKAWSQVRKVLGGTNGDWDLNGAPDVIAAAQGRVLIFSPEDGSLREELAAPTVKGRHETLGWAQIEKGVSAIFHYPGGWPDKVPALSKGGTVLWSYPSDRRSSINAAEWVDLDGDGQSEMLVGMNGQPGLHLVSSKGVKVWDSREVKGVWSVTGVGAAEGRPGLAFCTSADGRVHVFDSLGNEIRRLEDPALHALICGARVVRRGGEIQLLTLANPIVGQAAVALARDPEGKVLWRFPLGREAEHRAIHAADFTGDGTPDWVLEWPDEGVLIVLDSQGELVAEVGPGRPFTACFPVERKAKPAILCLATSTELLGLELDP